MGRKKKHVGITGVMIIMILFLSGCGGNTFNRYSEEKEKEISSPAEPEYIESEKDLESGHYYVCHAGKYYIPVWGDCSFDSQETGASSKRTTFFTDDNFGCIPTLYAGDYLVYYVSEAFKETFVFDRYRYVGYTIGICNLEKTQSGRYSFDADADNESIGQSTDAFRLTELSENDVIIDSIGKAELRAGNIDTGGTILGLKPNEYYSAEIYVGTTLKKYTVRADAIALTGMESFTSNDYSFMKSSIIRINIPSSLNSGYYSVNGCGIFRYVKGAKYDEDTDFNIENDLKTVKAEVDISKKDIQEDEEEISLPFTVQREADISVTVTYKEDDSLKYEQDAPVVKILGKSKIYTLTKKEFEYTETIHLVTGQYRLVISGMSGRAYEYVVSAKEEKNE